MVSTMKIGIIKPGQNISHVSEMEKDNSTFGGMYEIKGLYDDLVSLGHKVIFDLVGTEMLFIFNSNYKFSETEKQMLRQYKGPKIQCITDMNLMFSSNDIGKHNILTQVNGYNYHPFEKYIVRYKWDKNIANQLEMENKWLDRTNNMVYAGGSRDGNRDFFYKKYLMENKKLDKIFTSSKMQLPNKYDKIPMWVLFNVYKDTKFGLLIKDHLYNAFNFETQRIYEYMLNGMIVLHDKECNCMSLPNPVSKLEDIYEQMDFYIENEGPRRSRFQLQRELLIEAKSDVETYKFILENRIKEWNKK